MNSTKAIHEAFHDPAEWNTFFQTLSMLYPESKIEAIHDACTVSAGVTCLRLHETYGYSFEDLYEEALQLFSAPAPRRLSRLIDLSTYDTFVGSLHRIEARMDVLSAMQKLATLCTTY